jgi:trk system potassium uptake protein TrkA
MYIIIVGGGRIGYYLAQGLINEGHEVAIIEKDPAVYAEINEQLGIVCVRGDGCEASTLAEVGAGRADMFVATTGDDEDNLVACQVAKHKFNVPHTIARLRNPKRENLFKMLGIDVTVSSTQIILEQIEQEVPTHPLTHLLRLRDKNLEIVEIRILPQSAAIGKSLKELAIPEGSKLALIIPKQGAPFIPAPDSVIKDGDNIIAVTAPEAEPSLRDVLKSPLKKTR